MEGKRRHSTSRIPTTACYKAAPTASAVGGQSASSHRWCLPSEPEETARRQEVGATLILSTETPRCHGRTHLRFYLVRRLPPAGQAACQVCQTALARDELPPRVAVLMVSSSLFHADAAIIFTLGGICEQK